MLAREIIEAQVNTQQRELPVTNKFNLKKMGLRAERGVDDPNTGVYAVGTKDPGDPHMFRKKMRQPSNLDVDAYYQYIRYVRHYADANPFFPRVYRIDIKRDPRGLTKPSYQLEKLVDLRQADDLMGNQLNSLLKQRYLKDADRTGSIVNFIRDAIAGSFDIKNFQDPQLIEAIEVIQRFLEDFPYFKLDLHHGNVMIRFAGSVPQLVITDPAHDRGASIAGKFNTFGNRWKTDTDQTQTRSLVNMKSADLLDKYRGTAEDTRRQMRQVVKENEFMLQTPQGQQTMKLFTDTVYVKLESFEQNIDLLRDFVKLLERNKNQNPDSLPVTYTEEDMPEILALVLNDMARTIQNKGVSGLLHELRDKVRMFAK